jgi:hypothetical protein
MFLVIILIVAVLSIIFPKALIRFWKKLYGFLLSFSVQKHKELKKVIILFGGILFFISIYLFSQRFINVDEFGIFILMAISICFMLFSKYFSQSLIDYFKMTLNFYERQETSLVLFTRIIGVVCVSIIIYFKLRSLS